MDRSTPDAHAVRPPPGAQDSLGIRPLDHDTLSLGCARNGVSESRVVNPGVVREENRAGHLPPDAAFTLAGSTPNDPSGRPNTRTFTWPAAGSTGAITDGSDTMALVNGLIQYHFSSYQFTPAGS